MRGKDVFILQPTCSPTNDNLMELLVLVDALKRASAGRITAAIPYFGYARQDRRPRSARVPIAAKVVANMLQAVGVQRLLTMDLHADQIQGFFDIAVDNVYAAPVLLADLDKQKYDDLLVVSPDVGGVVRARAFAKRMECDLAIIDKRRPKANVSEVMNIIGEVEGRTCVIMDDIVDTAGTLCKAAAALKKHGAKRVPVLLHPRGAVGRGGLAHQRVGPRRAGRHRHHPAARRRQGVPAHPPDLGGLAARRHHPAHQQRGVGLLAVHGIRLSPFRPRVGRASTVSAWSRAGTTHSGASHANRIQGHQA